jgi:hypothetical protein
VFGCYDRVVAACEEYSASRADELTFVAALEIEHFLMRLRVLLDEVDYVIRIRLPKTVRGLGQPEGPGPMQYKQFSINKLVKLVDKHPAFYPHLARLLNSNRNNIQTYIELRDDIAHFRAQALIFRGETMSVGFIGSRETVQSQQAVPCMVQTQLIGLRCVDSLQPDFGGSDLYGVAVNYSRNAYNFIRERRALKCAHH